MSSLIIILSCLPIERGECTRSRKAISRPSQFSTPHDTGIWRFDRFPGKGKVVGVRDSEVQNDIYTVYDEDGKLDTGIESLFCELESAFGDERQFLARQTKHSGTSGATIERAVERVGSVHRSPSGTSPNFRYMSARVSTIPVWRSFADNRSCSGRKRQAVGGARKAHLKEISTSI